MGGLGKSIIVFWFWECLLEYEKVLWWWLIDNFNLVEKLVDKLKDVDLCFVLKDN